MKTLEKPSYSLRKLSEEERKKLKPFPVFKTDKEAEDFVDTADLTEYDFSDFRQVSIEELLEISKRQLEYKKKEKALYMRLPQMLFDKIKQKASESNMPYSRYIRLVLEESLKQPITN